MEGRDGGVAVALPYVMPRKREVMHNGSGVWVTDPVVIEKEAAWKEAEEIARIADSLLDDPPGEVPGGTLHP